MRLDRLPLRRGRARTRFIGLALALAVVATIAGAYAGVAGALEIDDVRPCPAAYSEPVGEEPSPQPPFVCPRGLVGTPYAVQLVGHGGCEPYFRFTVINGVLPPGLSISSSGRLSGTPTIAGRWSFRLRVQDLGAAEGGPGWCTSSNEANGEFVIAVDPGLIVTTEAAAVGTVGAFYNLALSAQVVSGPNQIAPPAGCGARTPIPTFCPLTWSIAQGQLPGRLTLNPVSGLIWGTPTAEGSASFVVRAALDDGRSATKSFTITIRRPLSIRAAKPFAVAGAPASWEVGVRFAARLEASGGTSAYSWSLSSGKLPTGLALTADGRIVGTPRVAGSFRATIRVADGEGRAADYPVLLRVAPRLGISTLELRSGKVGVPYRAKLTTTGGLGAKTWRVDGGSLPRGIRLDRAGGVLSGTPTRPGRYRMTLRATDALRATSTRTLVVDILA